MKCAPLLLACAGCALITESFETNDFSGDPYPIHVDTRSGGVLVGLRSGNTSYIATLDVLSPLTLIDPGPRTPATINTEDLTMLGNAEGTAGTPDIPRARFPAQQVLRLHPCPDADTFCKLGSEGGVQLEFDAIVGADTLAGDALRMRLGDDRVFVLADVGGRDAARTEACDAVYPSPFRGGGTLIVADTEVSFAGRRVTMQACLDPDPRQGTQVDRGTDALFVLSTSIGASLLSESAFDRYRQSHPTTLPLVLLPEKTIYLPSGPVTGRVFTIDRIALVARSTNEPLAPCRQVYAHRLLLDRNCDGSDDCPCEGDSGDFCPVPASVCVAPPAKIELLVVPDDNATLQALRTEFRPSIQEIDGVLGTGVMRDVELDIDYPHGRVLARCTTDNCQTRPALGEQNDRPHVAACIAQQPADTCGPPP